MKGGSHLSLSSVGQVVAGVADLGDRKTGVSDPGYNEKEKDKEERERWDSGDFAH
jgi:hypothetical protein